jgi:hypothetical protein
MGKCMSRNECCYYQPNQNSLFIKGYYRVLSDNKIVYPLSRSKKRHLSEFFLSLGQLVNLSEGLVVHIDGKYPPIDDTWVKIQLRVQKNNNVGSYYYHAE